MRGLGALVLFLLLASCTRRDSSFSLMCEVGEWVTWARCFDYVPHRSRDAKVGLQVVSDATDAFFIVRGRYPTRTDEVGVLVREGFLWPNGAKDPWGRPYVVQCPGKAHPHSCDVMTYGADRKPGGVAEDADLVND